MKKAAKILFAILFFTITLNAQNTGAIKGEVVSSKNTPLEQVSITTKNGDFNGMTNSEGVFSFPTIKPGKYTLIFSHIGFITATAEVTVRSKQTSIVPKIVLA